MVEFIICSLFILFALVAWDMCREKKYYGGLSDEEIQATEDFFEDKELGDQLRKEREEVQSR